MITVRLPDHPVIQMNATSLPDLLTQLGLDGDERDELYNFAVNGELIVHGEKNVQLRNGDEVEIVIAFSGG